MLSLLLGQIGGEPAAGPLGSVGAGRDSVFLFAHMLTPADRAAGVVDLLHREVSHEAIWSSAVPVVLLWLEVDAVAGTDYLHRAALALT
jgi:hypothetical protein